MPRGKNRLPNCLAAIFDSQLPSPKQSLKMPPKLPLPHKRGSASPEVSHKRCSCSSVDRPGARTLVSAAFEPFPSHEFRASIARTPFCVILWRSPQERAFLGPAKNHPWILTTLGCPGTPDPRNSSVDKFPEVRNFVGRGLLGLSLEEWSISPQGVLRNLSSEEFLGSGVPGHPRVVRIQGWFLASPIFFFFQNCPAGEGNCETIEFERQKLSRGNFCLAASRCLSRPSGSVLQNKGCRLLARGCPHRALESLGQKNGPRRDIRMTGSIACDRV